MKLTEFTAANVADVLAATGAKKSGKLLLVPVEAIHVVPGFNLRVTDTPEYVAGILTLKNSIIMEGFFPTKPLTGFAAELDGEPAFVIIDGHRRFEAALAAIEDGAEIETLPVILKDPKASDLDLAVALYKENTSVPLSMLERAVLAHRMLRSGETEEDVATRLGVTTRHVSDLKVIIAAPRAIRDLIKEGKLSASEAVIQLRKDPTGAKLLEAAEKIEQRAAEKATAKGAKDSKLTRQTIEGDAEPRVKMKVTRMNFKAEEGSTFLFEDAEPFFAILGEEWFKNGKKKAERIALEHVEIEVKIRRPASEEETEEEAPVVEARVAPVKAAAAPAKGAAKAPVKAAAPAKNGKRKPVATDDDDLAGDDDDLTGVPNLRDLGIAEPAGADL